jgi:hypothetical protein
MDKDMRYRDVQKRLQMADVRLAVPKYEEQFNDIDYRVIQCDVLSHSIQNASKEFVEFCSRIDDQELGQTLAQYMQNNDFGKLSDFLAQGHAKIDTPDMRKLQSLFSKLQRDYLTLLGHWSQISRMSRDLHDSIKRLVH